MKKYLILLTAFVFAIKMNAQTWTSLNTGTSTHLICIQFTSPDTGYACGHDGIILKTTDGGANWASQTSGTYELLYGLYFVNSSKGFAAGNSNTIVGTTDGGATWNPITPNGSSPGFAFRKLFFLNDMIGFGVGGVATSDTGRVVKTIDGGATWNTVATTNNSVYGIYFTSPTTGYYSNWNGEIYKSTDGGVNWTMVDNSAPEQLNCIEFTDANHGFASGRQGYILKTDDAGNTWYQVSTNTLDLICAVRFLDAAVGYAFGGNINANTGFILMTTDSGNTWVTDTAFSSRQYDGWVADANNVYSCGLDGTVLKKGLSTPLPCATFNVDLGPDAAFCNITILNAGIPNASYIWNTGDSNQAIPVLMSGTYYVTVDSAGCIDSDTINVIIGSQPIALGNDTTIGQNESITLDAGPGFSDYLWSNGAVSQSITVGPSNVSGSYDVFGYYMGQCTSADTIIISRSVGINEKENDRYFSVKENPTNGMVQLQYNGSNINNTLIEIRDVKGQQVFSENATTLSNGAIKQIDLGNHSKGVYFVKISNVQNNLQQVLKIVLQ